MNQSRREVLLDWKLKTDCRTIATRYVICIAKDKGKNNVVMEELVGMFSQALSSPLAIFLKTSKNVDVS